MKLEHVKYIYFLGIGGIGMSALAKYFHRLGKQVSGYDKTPSTITAGLEELGIAICFSEDLAAVDHLNAEETLVVLTPAVPKNHAQWHYFLQHSFTILKRAEVLGLITQDTFCFAVAGTHGKTTTSAILGHILYTANTDVTAFVGGIVEQYESNLIGTGKTVTVVEADEFDRSFLKLSPNLLCVTSIDADHLDIYGTAENIAEGFNQFAEKVPSDKRFVAKGIPISGHTISSTEDADVSAKNIRIENGNYVFDVSYFDEEIIGLEFGLPGRHNLSNALTAMAMAKAYGIDNADIKQALKSFRGIERRFSQVYKSDDRVYIDDYAHHPTEIAAVHQALRELYPNDRILALFQPHLFSRTQDFGADFAKELSAFDEVALLEIYPARELPIPGINSAWLLSQMQHDHATLIEKSEVLNTIKKSKSRIVLTIGAGDIGVLVNDIKMMLHGKK
jgi:UDP-N-acetylmuramate--alanine ligase